MATLTIGGQPREIRFSGEDLDLAERGIVKHGGRVILDVLGNRNAMFTKFELEWLLWGAWRHKLPAARITTLTKEFYLGGGTVRALNEVVVGSIIDSGIYIERAVREGADGDDDGAAAPDPPIPEEPALG